MTVLLAAEGLATRHGMAPMVNRIRRSLRACGVRRAAPRSTVGRGVTARESEVLELVRAGLTNQEIGARLGLARRTVESQIASSAAKLGASGRAHAAALSAGCQGETDRHLGLTRRV